MTPAKVIDAIKVEGFNVMVDGTIGMKGKATDWHDIMTSVESGNIGEF
jgi:hypothetical protein